MIRTLYVSPIDPAVSADGLYADVLTRALERTGRVEVIRGAIKTADRTGLDRDGPSALAGHIEALAKEQSADLLHLHYEPGLFSPKAVLGITRRAGRLPPIVVTVHRVAAYDGRLRLRGLRQARAVAQEWLLARHARLLIAHADHSRDVLRKRYPRRKVETQLMAVPEDACDLSGGAGGPVLFFGNHHPGKGVLEFVRAMKALPEQHAIVAGKRHAKWAKYNDAVSSELAGAPNVTVEDGWATNERKHALLREASVVALPYRVPGSGSAVLCDAIAHEKPVVSSLIEPLRSLVEGLGVGVAVETQDRPAFSQALLAMATADGAERSPALKRAKELCSEDSVASRLALLYEGVVR